MKTILEYTLFVSFLHRQLRPLTSDCKSRITSQLLPHNHNVISVVFFAQYASFNS